MAEVSRRRAAAGLALAGAGGWRAWAQPKAAELAFLGVGDWGRDGSEHQSAVAARMGEAARAAVSRFTISTGDNFYDSGVPSVAAKQWKTSFEDVYTDPALQTPWYVALGNHDYRGNPQAQVEYSAKSPRWRMPRRYFAVAASPQLELFVLDTSPLVHRRRDKAEGPVAANVASQDVSAQLKWLDEALASSQAAWKLVVGHHTIHSGGTEHGDTRELVAMVKPILERRGVQAYVNGHEHDLQHIRRGAVDYITTGAGSRIRATTYVEGTKFAKAVSGFAVFRASRDALDLRFRDYTGAEIYKTTLARERPMAGAA